MIDCLLALATGTVTIALTTAPYTNDMSAVIGAMLATVIAVLDARKRDSTLGNTVTVILGSSFVGSLAPGVLFYNVWPDLAIRFTWHVWASLGFIAGLIGWSIVLAVTGVIQRRKDAMINALANRWIGTRFPPPKEPPDVEDDLPRK